MCLTCVWRAGERIVGSAQSSSRRSSAGSRQLRHRSNAIHDDEWDVEHIAEPAASYADSGGHYAVPTVPLDSSASRLENQLPSASSSRTNSRGSTSSTSVQLEKQRSPPRTQLEKQEQRKSVCRWILLVVFVAAVIAVSVLTVQWLDNGVDDLVWALASVPLVMLALTCYPLCWPKTEVRWRLKPVGCMTQQLTRSHCSVNNRVSSAATRGSAARAAALAVR